MRGRPIRVTPLLGSPQQRGEAHGAAHAHEIRHYAAERVAIIGSGSWSGRPVGRADALALAASMLPAQEAYAPDLHAEMLAMAAAAGISPEEALIVGGFTDIVDTMRAMGGEGLPVDDDCTAVVVPDHRADGAGFVAQTWDMHDSATEHVVLLDVQPDDGPAALVFSTVGCIGQIGMNEAGIAVGINNLVAADGRIGVTWPLVVRKVLQQTVFEDALAAIVDADVAGGHSFLLLAADGRGCMVEAMPTHREVFPLDDEVLVHTNHCLVPATIAREALRPDDLQASSVARLRHAAHLLEHGPVDPERLMDLTRDGDAICRTSQAPHHVESCGAAVMRPATGDFWACWGLPSENDFHRFGVGSGG